MVGFRGWMDGDCEPEASSAHRCRRTAGSPAALDAARGLDRSRRQAYRKPPRRRFDPRVEPVTGPETEVSRGEPQSASAKAHANHRHTDRNVARLAKMSVPEALPGLGWPGGFGLGAGNCPF